MIGTQKGCQSAENNIEQEALMGCFWRVVGKEWLRRKGKTE
jgi:hypothetical protein